MSTTITIVVDGPSGSVGATAVGDDAGQGPAPADIEGGHESQADSADGAGLPPRPEMSGVGVAGDSAGMTSATESSPAPSPDLALDAGGGAAAASGPARAGQNFAEPTVSASAAPTQAGSHRVRSCFAK